MRRGGETGAGPEAGGLLALEALDESGLAVTSEGAFVRIVAVSPPNPLICSDAEAERIAEAFGLMIGRLRPGQSLQFFVEARPVHLAGVLERAREQVRAVAGEMPGAGRAARDELARARWRLYAAMEESLRCHADRQAAVELGAYVVVPYLPDQRVRGSRLRRQELVALWRRGLGRAPLVRDLAAHRRAARESLQHTDAVRSELDALDLPTRLLNGEQVAALLWRRFNPTLADRGAGPRASATEIVGELGALGDAERAAEAARRLRERIVESAFEWKPREGPLSCVRIGRDLEQTIYAGSTAEATCFGWLLGAMQTRKPFCISVHVHATDRQRERQRHKWRHKRIHSVNRGAEMRGHAPDYDRNRQEREHEELLAGMSGSGRLSLYWVSIYQSIREPGPSPDPDELAHAVELCAEEISAAADLAVHRGEAMQHELFLSTVPLGRDVARRARKYATRNAADSIPLVGTACGSPEGIPLGFAEPGRTIERIDPYDREHANHTLLISGKSGHGKTAAAIMLLCRCLTHGATVFALDRAGHYELLTRLVPGGQQISIGSDERFCVNSWDVPDPAGVSLEKIAFLVSLHSLLVGSRGSSGVPEITPLERNMLDGAIRAVYARAAASGETPRESMLRDVLRERAAAELDGGDAAMASTLRSLAERLESFCGEGMYAYLLDRPTTVTADAPLVVFDTRRVPDPVLKPVMFLLAEYVTRQVEARRDREAARMADPGASMFAGRSVFLIDEGWHWVGNAETGGYANDLARRARHLGLFLIVISQQFSDFDTEHGRALIANSTMRLFFRQEAEDLGFVQDALRLSDQEVATIARLKTLKGVFSQAYLINGTRGRGQLSVRLGPSEYWIATSEPNVEAPLRERALAECDGDAWAAIARLAARGVDAREDRDGGGDAVDAEPADEAGETVDGGIALEAA